MKNMKVVVCIVAFFALVFFSISFTISEDRNHISFMRKHKHLVEKSYVNGIFSLPKQEIGSGISYTIFAEGNKVWLKYNGVATKGKQWSSIVLTAEANKDASFVWSCMKHNWIMDTKCEL